MVSTRTERTSCTSAMVNSRTKPHRAESCKAVALLSIARNLRTPPLLSLLIPQLHHTTPFQSQMPNPNPNPNAFSRFFYQRFSDGFRRLTEPH
ncbi:hypothetical protein ACLKA6_009994 [Drosophila palustris]